MTTIAEVASDIAEEFGEAYTANPDVKIQWDRWTVEAVEEIIASGRWFSSNNQSTVTTVASTRTYALPATASEIRTIEKPGGGKLPYVTIDRLTARAQQLTAEGTPTSWYVDSIGASQEVVIGLHPVPDAILAYEVFVLDKPPALSDTSTIPLGTEFERVIRYYIRSKAKFNENQLELSQVAQQKGDAALALLNARFVDPPKPGSRLPSVSHKEVAQLPVAKG